MGWVVVLGIAMVLLIGVLLVVIHRRDHRSTGGDLDALADRHADALRAKAELRIANARGSNPSREGMSY